MNSTVIATEVETLRTSGVAPVRAAASAATATARALYGVSTGSTRGVIAKTSGPNNKSLTVTGAFTVTGQDNTTTSFLIGTMVNKIGRTTGWTQGNVTNTCVNTNVSGPNITQLCQTFVSNPGGPGQGGGDSGSNVLPDHQRIECSAGRDPVGWQWPGTLFVFSLLKQIRTIGPIIATI